MKKHICTRCNKEFMNKRYQSLCKECLGEVETSLKNHYKNRGYTLEDLTIRSKIR